jgi:sarcosine oxidase
VSLAYDVIVIGLGAMGSAACYQLARRGQRVLGLDALPAGHTLGSSHGESRIIRMAYYEHPSYVPLLRRAYELWAATQAEVGRELLRLTGGLYVGRPEGPLVAGSLLSARAHALPHEVLSAEEIRARFPGIQPAGEEVGLFEERAGVLFPERCISAHLELAARYGAELHHARAVLEWQAGDSDVEVHTADARYTAGRLVLTPGAWFSKLLRDLGLQLTVERIPVVWFEPRRPIELPIYIWELNPHPDPGASVFYGVPHLEWPGAKVGRHHQGQVCDPDTVDRQATEADEAPIRAFVEARIPHLAGPTASRRICLYTTTPDEHFIIDQHPGHANVVFAGGFSGHGFKFASVVGEILADLVTTGRATPDADFLRYARLMEQAVPEASAG